MSEVAASTEDFHAQPAGRFPQASAGTLLRLAREAAGLHIAALAVSLKVPVKKLEALEADRIDLLPDAVFARALAASVCRTLKTDPAPILASLPQTAFPRLQSQSNAINAPFSGPGEGTRSTVWNQLSKPVVIAALALVIGALVLVLLPSAERALLPGDAARTGVLASPAAPVAAVANDASPQAALISSPALASANPSNLAVAPIGGATVDISAPPQALASAAEPVLAVGADTVVLKSTGTSWVEVLNAKRAVQLRKTMVPGEAIGVSGDLPLYVTVGRADTVQVQVRGKSLDLGSVTKDNVARFEVR